MQTAIRSTCPECRCVRIFKLRQDSQATLLPFAVLIYVRSPTISEATDNTQGA